MHIVATSYKFSSPGLLQFFPAISLTHYQRRLMFLKYNFCISTLLKTFFFSGSLVNKHNSVAVKAKYCITFIYLSLPLSFTDTFCLHSWSLHLECLPTTECQKVYTLVTSFISSFSIYQIQHLTLQKSHSTFHFPYVTVCICLRSIFRL